MRILHVDSEKNFGGGQRQLIFLIRELQVLGAQHAAPLQKADEIVQALAAWPDSVIAGALREAPQKIEVFPLEQRNDADIFSAIKLKRYIRDWAPDIVHTHTSRSLSMTWLARKCLLLKRPPVIINTRRVAFALKGSVARSKYRGGADYHIAVSRACYDQIAGAGVEAQRVVIIPDGVEIPENISREESRENLLDLTGFKKEHLIVGACGNLLAVKRFDWLVEAVARARRKTPNIRLVIFGDGRCRKELEAATKELGQEEAISIPGHVDRPERYFAGLDIFAMPSRDEGLGTSLIDAMARGVPLLGANTSGIKDVIEESVNGVMFDPLSVDDLVAKLLMLAGNAALRESLSKGPAIARDKFDIKNISKKVLDFYTVCI